MTFRHLRFLVFSYAVASVTLLLFSCATSQNIPPVNESEPIIPEVSLESAKQETNKQKSISVVLGGDIMAHKPNFNMKDYDSIWDDIRPILQKNDLAFANLEFPIVDNLPLSSYPKFNVHDTYPDAAVRAGFNVFSLANNHAADQGIAGIKSTLEWATTKEEKTKNSDRPVYAAGLKRCEDDPMSYRIIKEKGWTILFTAITEISNEKTGINFINYVQPTSQCRSQFLTSLTQLRADNPCDLFIVSVHCNSEEYVPGITNDEEKFYHDILSNGADVVWANHPHIAKPWEMIRNASDGKCAKFIVYAAGNTISAQRWDPAFDKPADTREYTGEGYLYCLTFSKQTEKGPPVIESFKPVLITTYIDPSWNFVVRILDNNFISELYKGDRKKWADYLTERKKLMGKIQGFTTWQ